ncbi:protein RTM1 [Penicillium diatomitis]|uniref:Protein RTM1 n=1 Tax=Penicillium diatomitis TaxID=2819901 RepID=A0A9W9XGZ6_9EURO|nr:protein RTM1 [Penicillium diatomitis]KAJ5492816.1 protein RTM1 [Penicillium diatomitis]
MFLGRIILVLQAESHALKKKWLTKVFVTGDVLPFLLQGAGKSKKPQVKVEGNWGYIRSPRLIESLSSGGIQSNGSLEGVKTGEHIIVAGLVIQILFFAFFIVTATHFDRTLMKYPIPRARSPSIPWRRHLNILYLTSGLIMIRSMFRLIEYAQGNGGYILHHELCLYIFDSLLMFLTMIIFNVVHPQEIGQLLSHPVQYEMTAGQV